MISDNVIILILFVIAILTILSVMSGPEGFCNCTGTGFKTAKPTYYVYRPTGDVSTYSSTPSSTPPILQCSQNLLGWQTGMPYDSFSQSLTGKSWAAGSDPDPSVNTSVPFVSLQEADSGGYLKNYGSKCGGVQADKMFALSPPSSFSKDLKFVTGPSGYPNMLSDGTPEFVGPAGSFTSPKTCPKTCPSVNAYNLGIGVI
jgi:hypothetical protein